MKLCPWPLPWLRDSLHQDFMMCCHGGLELGYSPHELLHAPRSKQFELIEMLWRKDYFNTKLKEVAE